MHPKEEFVIVFGEKEDKVRIKEITV